MIQFLTALQLMVTERLDRRDETGATMVEYGLLVALIAVVVAVGATMLGTSVAALYTRVAGSI